MTLSLDRIRELRSVVQHQQVLWPEQRAELDAALDAAETMARLEAYLLSRPSVGVSVWKETVGFSACPSNILDAYSDFDLLTALRKALDEAEEIDAEHGDGIASETRALAMKLKEAT